MNNDDKIYEIKLWLLSKGGYYVDIPEESVYNIYNLLIDNTFTEPQREVEYLYYGLYYRALLVEEKMIKYTLMSIECGNTIAMRNLATMYRRKGDDLNMIKYYLMAIEKGDATAMNNLAVYYSDKQDYSNMTKYYLMAIENGDIVAMDNFAGYYCYRKDYDNMTKYYLMAIENGSTISAISLANYYVKTEQYFSAIKYYVIALNMGDCSSIDKIIRLIKKDRLDIDCYIEMIEQLDYELYKKVVDYHVGLTLLYKIHRSKIDLMELPFKYSPDNEGFVQAKEDFILNLKKEAI